jgi:photosystem II stability/assembly factor-like uncharacterized protein
MPRRPHTAPRTGHRPFRCLTASATILAAALAAGQPVHAQSARPGSGAYDPALFSGLEYRMIGPTRGGRVTSVMGVPSQPRTFYMGEASGGVWKTTDGGATWLPISDDDFKVGSIGSIDVSISDPNIIYVGTGSDDIRSNVSIGHGVYKSTDAGKTWRYLGLYNTGQTGAVRIDPTNPDIVYLAAIGNPFADNPERGVYRTTDGGQTWQKVLYLSDSVGAVDIELQPGNPKVVYASMWRGERKPWTIISGAHEGGIYKSTDGGDHWTKLGNGLPTELFGKSNIAVTAADPNRVYALIEAKPGGGLYRSDDAGEHWTLVNTQATLITRPFYYTTIAADPTNADVVYAGAESFFKSTDGGKTFRRISTPHGDNHDMWINPHDGKIMIQANDGGANVSYDGGETWSTQDNQPTAEIYQVAVDNQYPYRVYGAQQDASTVIVTSLPNIADARSWQPGPGCETGPIIPHPTMPDTVYGACKGQFSRLNRHTGQEKNYWVGAQYLYGFNPKDMKLRFQRVSPMEISPHDPRVIYYGSQYVHRTTDEGVHWETISPDLTANDPIGHVASGTPITRDATGEEYYATLYAIRESPLEKGVIWAGSNDGPVHVTRDNGKTWTDVTPKALPPGGRVQNIEPSPHRKGSAYIAVYRYLLGDFHPYIYRTDNYGKSWTLLTDGKNGIPADDPTRVVREDPNREGLLYAGTEFGMFASFDNGGHWQSLQLNLPITPVTDIQVHRHDLVISTQGRSFWILDDITPLEQLDDKVASSTTHLFTPDTAYRFRYRSRGGPDDPQYPPAGAMIDYYLAEQPSGPVTLEILDAKGEVVRSFAGLGTRDSGLATASGARGSAPRAGRFPSPESRVPSSSGMHRFIWDLQYPGPESGNGRGGRGGGPMVAPGTFRARLTVGDWSDTQPLVVRADPRVTKDGVTQADLEQQLAHNLRVRDAVSQANRVSARIDEARERLVGAAGAAADTLRQLDALHTQLVTEPIRYSEPKLLDQLNYLYRMTLGADQRVGQDAIDRYRELKAQLDGVVAQATKLLGPPRERAASRTRP